MRAESDSRLQFNPLLTENSILLSAISSFEIALPCPDPAGWLDEALDGFEMIPITESIARKAALWDWEHKDPADRIIAAAACIHGVELWHSDTVLKRLPGFPQRYFKAPV